MNMQVAAIAFTWLVVVFLAAPPLSAQEPLVAARDLYASADYEAALRLLDGLNRDRYAPAERQTIEFYRALCLLAVERREDAELSIAKIITVDPLYRPTDDITPRMRTVISDAKRRILPGLIKEHYQEARSAFDRKDFDVAASRFKQVIDVLKAPEIKVEAAQPPLSDLGTLAAGFYDLSVKSVPPPPPLVAKEVESVSFKPTQPTIYEGGEPGVVPPIVRRQEMPRFPQAVRRGGYKGIIEIVVDEIGTVEAAAIIAQTVEQYDRMLLEAARNWLYVPASRDGKPVKFRRRIQININEPRP
jgi:hypothetical protein